ncbi:MAG: helix-turn-helix domain-containing protein [Desulfuromonadaceae bacterium]|nr:helix-turn-helix domain-containing protein [Desulfuromonadaceae bacterium]
MTDSDEIDIITEISNGPYDFHCPQMGSGLNTWRSLCIQRQKFESLRAICGAGEGCKALEIAEKVEKHRDYGNVSQYRDAIIELTVEGMSTRQIAGKLGISKSTVKKYRRQCVY